MGVDLHAPTAIANDGSDVISRAVDIAQDCAGDVPPPHVSSDASPEVISHFYEIADTACFILKGGYKRIALQFPDGHLPNASSVIELLQAELESHSVSTDEPRYMAILGDTSFGSCCVDEVAAQHMSADCLIHFGNACLAPCSTLPTRYVLGRHPVESPSEMVESITSAVVEASCQPGEVSPETVRSLVFYDVAYHFAMKSGLRNGITKAMPHAIITDLTAETLPRFGPTTLPDLKKHGLSCGPTSTASGDCCAGENEKVEVKEGDNGCCGGGSSGCGGEAAVECVDEDSEDASGEDSESEGNLADLVLNDPSEAPASSLDPLPVPDTDALADTVYGRHFRLPEEKSSKEEPVKGEGEASEPTLMGATAKKIVAAEKYVVVWIGGEGRALRNLLFEYPNSVFVVCNPAEGGYAQRYRVRGSKALMKRYYQVQKIKDATTIGVVAATTSVRGFREQVAQLKDTIIRAGKKPYTFIVGKLNVAKLANFPEIDAFCLVACPETSLVEDSREYMAPLVTPWEVRLALDPNMAWTGDYVTDFRRILPMGGVEAEEAEEEEGSGSDDPDAPRFSLITGTYVNKKAVDASGSGPGELMVRPDGSVIRYDSPAAAALASREWQGLETKVGATEVGTIVQGRVGIARGYDHEADVKNNQQGGRHHTFQDPQ